MSLLKACQGMHACMQVCMHGGRQLDSSCLAFQPDETNEAGSRIMHACRHAATRTHPCSHEGNMGACIWLSSLTAAAPRFISFETATRDRHRMSTCFCRPCVFARARCQRTGFSVGPFGLGRAHTLSQVARWRDRGRSRARYEGVSGPAGSHGQRHGRTVCALSLCTCAWATSCMRHA